MTEIEKWGERSGATYVALATRRAAAFYEALGYEASATYFKRELSATTTSGHSHLQE